MKHLFTIAFILFLISNSLLAEGGYKEVDNLRLYNALKEYEDIAVPTGIERANIEYEPRSNHLPEKFSMQYYYPIPFNPSTTIAYKLLQQSDVEWTIYDTPG